MNSHAQTRGEFAIVEASTLNVRSAPDGDAIDRLSNGTVVMIDAVSGNWVKVVYLAKNSESLKRGWVASRYLKLLGDRSAKGGYTFLAPGGADFSISVTGTDLDCSEGLREPSDGFDRCKVEIDFTMNSYFRGSNVPTVTAYCEAKLAWVSQSGQPMTKTASEVEMVRLASGGSHSGRVDIGFSFWPEKAVKAQLQNANCEIESAW